MTEHQVRREAGDHVGRRADVNGRELLLAAALKLFAEDGIDAVSIRAVNREAGLGPASMHYHFGTKEALVEAVLRLYGERVLDSVSEEASRLLEVAQVGSRDIVTMLARPYLELLESEPRSGVEWIQFLAQLAQGDPDRVASSILNKSSRKALALAYPKVPASRRERALRICLVVLVTHLGQIAPPSRRRAPASDVELLLVFVSGGLEAALGEGLRRDEAWIA